MDVDESPIVQDRNLHGGNCTSGQLTAYGSHQHVILGAAFRAAYVDGHKVCVRVCVNPRIWTALLVVRACVCSC